MKEVTFYEILFQEINYVDTYHRRGMPHPWPVPDLPLVLGFEGVGIVKEIGEKVKKI